MRAIDGTYAMQLHGPNALKLAQHCSRQARLTAPDGLALRVLYSATCTCTDSSRTGAVKWAGLIVMMPDGMRRRGAAFNECMYR